MNYLVILDPGHGLNTQGKRTPKFDDGSFMRENEFNRNVIRKIDQFLEQYENIDVIITTTEKRDIPLDERVGRVNILYNKVKTLYDKIILVSVHANALTGSWGTQNGTETYHYPTNTTDKEFAEVIHKNLIKKINLYDRGVKGGNFQILREVKCIAALVECAYMDNLKEANLLMSEEFRKLCAEGIFNGIKEYFGLEVKPIEVNYKQYKDGTCELKSDPLNLIVKMVNKSNKSIVEPNCVNGTFFWYEDQKKTRTYPTSILFVEGKLYQAIANHYADFGTPQSVFIIYKNGKVDMKRIRNIVELDLEKVKLAIGGLGLRNTLDPTFRYSPVTEGFKGAFSDVLATRNKTVIGYNKRLNKVYLLTRKNISHGSLINLIADNSTGEAYDIALSLDGGGSTFMNNHKDMVIYGDGRLINNIIGFGI